MAGIKDLTQAQIEKVDLLMRNGWSLDHIYGDGPISLSKVVANVTEQVAVFVDMDGNLHRPRTAGTMIACSELAELGIKIKELR